jgi:hypothetical protein
MDVTMRSHRDFWSELLSRLYPQRSPDHSSNKASDGNTDTLGITSEARLAVGDQPESVKPLKNPQAQ